MATFRGPIPRHPRLLERRLLADLQPRLDLLVELASQGLTVEEIISEYRRVYPASRDTLEMQAATQRIIDHTRAETARTAAFGADVSTIVESVVVDADDITRAVVSSLDGMVETFALGMDAPDPPAIRQRIIRSADVLAQRQLLPPDKALHELALAADEADDEFRRRTQAQARAEGEIARARLAEMNASASGDVAGLKKAQDARAAAERRVARRQQQVAEAIETRRRKAGDLARAAHRREVDLAIANVKDAKNNPEVIEARRKLNIERAKKRAKKKQEDIAREQATQARAKATKELQQAVGVDEYEWVNVNNGRGDLRVRPEHRALNGRIFKWSDPSPDPNGYPGEPYGCRCKARPVRRTISKTRRRSRQQRGRFRRRRATVTPRPVQRGRLVGQPLFAARANPTLSEFDQ